MKSILSQIVIFTLLSFITESLCQKENSPITLGTVGKKKITISPDTYGQGSNWADALTYCQRFKSKLISVDSSEENAAIKAFLKKEAEADRGHHAWTSGTDYFTEGKWYWMKSKSPIQYSDWNEGQPNQNEWYNCLVISPGGWSSMYCEVDHARAICEN